MYENFYKFSGKPFQLSPDRRFFFNSRAHNRAMSYLRYGFRQGEGFIVITGGIGTGKSMLVANLLAEVNREDTIAAQLVSTQVEAEDMLRLVSVAFGLPQSGANKATLLAEMEAYFRARRAEGKRLLLVVDEAQNLPRQSIEELRMLSNFQHDGHALLQSFLVGQEELKQTLRSAGMEQVRQRIIAAHHLRSLDQEELRAYIEYRLSLVGWTGDPQITEDAYRRLHEVTGGVPRRINTLIDRLLLYGAIEEMHRLDLVDVDRVVAEVSEEVGFDQEQQPATKTMTATAPAGTAAEAGLSERVEVLEQQVAELNAQLHKVRQMVKKAILLQMDIESD